ncbi:MAG: polyhydroxybutyrate depolymerase [Aestuariibacter sp.]
MKNVRFSVLGLAICSSLAIAEVPKLNLDIEQITVSGLSSGGFMATQMHVAFAEWVAGAGIVASGPYYCARNSLQTALQECLAQTTIDVDIAAIEQQRVDWQSAEKVAAIDAMQNDKVWILHGEKDTRLSRRVATSLVQQYQAWVNPDNVLFVDDKPFAHHFPTISQGKECSTSETPFLGLCDYDTAGAILTHLLPDIQQPKGSATGQLIAFKQQAIAGDAEGSLAEQGYIYVPTSCKEGDTCEVHVSFHGCNQFADAPGVDNQYAMSAGFNRWADANNLVVVYPQTQASNFNPFNPQGCWDWWGYTGEDYATRDGAQPKAIEKIVKYFAGEQNEQ